jgi:hypothetical protein
MLTASDSIVIQVAYGATPTYLTSSYSNCIIFFDSGIPGVNTFRSNFSASYFYLTGDKQIDNLNTGFLESNVFLSASKAFNPWIYDITGNSNYINTFGAFSSGTVSGSVNGTNSGGVITAIKIFAKTGSVNLYYGSVSLYGITN